MINLKQNTKFLPSYRVSDRDVNGLVGMGGIFRVWSKVLGQHPTVCGRQQAGHDSSPCYGVVGKGRGHWGKGEKLPVIEGIDLRLALWLPGRTAEERALNCLSLW